MTTSTRTKANRVQNLAQASLAANIALIEQQDRLIEQAKERRAKAVASIEHMFGRGKHVAPGIGEVTISANNVYDEAVMRKMLTPWQFERKASKRVLDRAKVKANYPEVYEASKDERGVRASVTLYKA